MRKRIRKKRLKKLWWKSLGACRCTRIFMAEVNSSGKLQMAALSHLHYTRTSETDPDKTHTDLFPVRFF